MSLSVVIALLVAALAFCGLVAGLTNDWRRDFVERRRMQRQMKAMAAARADRRPAIALAPVVAEPQPPAVMSQPVATAPRPAAAEPRRAAAAPRRVGPPPARPARPATLVASEPAPGESDDSQFDDSRRRRRGAAVLGGAAMAAWLLRR